MVLVLITAAGLGYMTWDRNRDYRTAVGIWTDTVAKRPVNFRAHNNLGVALTRKGRYAEAVGPYQEAVRLKPDYQNAYSNLGLLSMQKGDFDGAEQYFQTMLKLAPERTEPYVVLAELRTAQGRINEAIQLYRQALRLAPGSKNIEERLKKSSGRWFTDSIRPFSKQTGAACIILEGYEKQDPSPAYRQQLQQTVKVPPRLAAA